MTLIGFLSFGQENKLDQNDNGLNSIETSELETIYVKALNSRFSLLLSSGWNYVELNEYGKRISEMDVSDRYKFLTNEELIELSIKKKKSIRIIRLTHKIVANDSVDINFGEINLTAKRKIHFNNGLKFRKAELLLNCGGTDGYEPDMRFVFNDEKKQWELKSGRFKIPTE